MSNSSHPLNNGTDGDNSSPDPNGNSGRRTSKYLIRNDEVSKYVVLGWIGKGSISSVYKAENPTLDYHSPLRCVAFKRIPQQHTSIGTQESVILSLFKQSKYIVDHYGTFNMNGQLVLAFELLDWKRSLNLSGISPRSSINDNNNIGSISDRQTSLAKIALQLLLGVNDMHSKGFIHGDIKPTNIMFERGHRFRLKLIDLGNAVSLSTRSQYYEDFQIQSIGYRAPEILFGDEEFSEKIDIWSIGVVLFELYFNSLFKSQECEWTFIRHTQLHHIITVLSEYLGPADFYKNRGKFWKEEYSYSRVNSQKKFLLKASFDHDPEDTTNLCDFIIKLMDVNHINRLSATDALKHPFLKETLLGEWGDVLF